MVIIGSAMPRLDEVLPQPGRYVRADLGKVAVDAAVVAGKRERDQAILQLTARGLPAASITDRLARSTRAVERAWAADQIAA